MNRASRLFNEFQRIPFGVVGEFGVPLRRAQAGMPHQLANGVQRDIFARQPRAERVPQGVNDDFESGIGDSVVQAKDVDGLGEGMGQGVGADLTPFRRCEDEVGWKRWINGLQYPDDRVIHEGGAFPLLPLDMDEAILEIEVLTPYAEYLAHAHTRVHGNECDAVQTARKDFKHTEKTVKFGRREEALPLIIRWKEFDLGEWALVKAPFDHAAYDVEDVQQDEVDRRGGKGAACGQYCAFFRLADGFCGHQVHFEGFEREGRNVFQQGVLKNGTDVDGVMVEECRPVLEERYALLREDFPCLPIGEINRFGLDGVEHLRMPPLPKTLGPDFAGQHGGVSLATPPHLFVYQLAVELVRNVKADVGLSVEPFRFACTSVHTGVLCLVTVGHWGIPSGLLLAYLNVEKITIRLTKSATDSNTQQYILSIYPRCCTIPLHEATYCSFPVKDASISTCINHFCNFLLMTFLCYL